MKSRLPIPIVLFQLLLLPAVAKEPMEQALCPLRVHVFEDFETEIEKRWWLRGTPVTEAKALAPSLSASVPNLRACRAAETKDFDDKQGDPSKTWKAVIFNPVPGPPMGAKTRLSFRYFLKGTDTIRVQIYSLTNNYHRRHFLTGLAQNEWRSADVDMTQLRRPDGTGGPLASDERIDDIQFYIATEADLLIDDVVLYEAAPAGGKELFPRRIIFTGWFDTGKQGAEWPGEFEIVPHEAPLTWKCAKSMAGKNGGQPLIRLQLRGRRPLSAINRLRANCRLSGGTLLRIELADGSTGKKWETTVDGIKAGGWQTITADFSNDTTGQFADELTFLIPRDAALLLDDVLLYEPRPGN